VLYLSAVRVSVSILSGTYASFRKDRERVFCVECGWVGCRSDTLDDGKKAAELSVRRQLDASRSHGKR